MEKLFFEVLQVAVGTREALSRPLTSSEWSEIYRIAKKQTLSGVCFAGSKRLPSYQAMPISLRKEWLGGVSQILQRNRELNGLCAELCDKLHKDGFSGCILKGQGNAANYPVWLKELRTPGDIDIWVLPVSLLNNSNNSSLDSRRFIKEIVDYVYSQHSLCGSSPKEGVRYHHIDAPNFKNAEVEVHYRPSFIEPPLRNYRLQKWFIANRQFCTNETNVLSLSGENVSIPIPSSNFNAVYQLIHIYKHLFDEGIGLRQLLDYYFVLKSLDKSINSQDAIVRSINKFGLSRFASAVMYVLAKVFEVNNEDQIIDQSHFSWMIVPPNKKEGEFLIAEIMQAGNFGKNDKRIKRATNSSILLPFVHAFEKCRRNARFLIHYPEEVFWEPLFRLYHWIWRKLRLWRYY